MGLASGTKLGPYEVLSPLGAGGMGEVYRARDTRLSRTVAIKILPTHLSDNPEAKQRFDREARAISSLNHPGEGALSDLGGRLEETKEVQRCASYLRIERRSEPFVLHLRQPGRSLYVRRRQRLRH